MSTATETELGQRVRFPLTLQDRCDGPGVKHDGCVRFCGAQAFVRVTLDSGELTFCGHHYSTYEPTFLLAGYRVQDERNKINEKPSISGTWFSETKEEKA